MIRLLHRYCEKQCVKYVVKLHKMEHISILQRIKFKIFIKIEFRLRKILYPTREI